MFERLSDRGRMVMALANQEAYRLNHDFIGTEHILLGIVAEGKGVGACVLKNLGVDLSAIRSEVEKLLKPGSREPSAGKLPQTPRSKKVLEYAIEECRMLNSGYVGTEHLLLGILREGEGLAGKVLRGLGITLEQAREETVKVGGRKGRTAEPFRLPHKLSILSPEESVSDTAGPVLIRDDTGTTIGMVTRIEVANEIVRRYNEWRGGEGDERGETPGAA